MINDNPISAFSKNRNESDFVTASELLSALKSDVFSSSPKESPVVIHAAADDGDLHLLKIVYKCGACKSLHFIAGEVNSDDVMMTEKSVIYADCSHSPIAYISRGELISIIEKFIEHNDGNQKVDISTSDDEVSFPLTEIFKCSSGCPSVHLCSFYYED